MSPSEAMLFLIRCLECIPATFGTDFTIICQSGCVAGHRSKGMGLETSSSFAQPHEPISVVITDVTTLIDMW